MPGWEIMDGWDVALIAIAGYVAIIALVRLMIGRRNQVVEELVEESKRTKRRQSVATPAGPAPSRANKTA